MDGQESLLGESELQRLINEIDEAPAPPRAQDVATEIREFHGWTLDKLDVFEKYLKLYRRVAGSGAFIDAFAGTGYGLAVRQGRSERREGSSLLAARSGAFAMLDLIEKDEGCRTTLMDAVKGLPAEVQDRIRVHPGDCNVVLPQLLAEERFDASRPCFVLLDQESTQLDWATIETLADWKAYEPPPTLKGRPKSCKVELWILFNSHQVVNRLWPKDRGKYPESFSPPTLDKIFGGRDAWWDLWKDQQPSSALVRRFADRLRGLGYVYAIPQVIKDPATGRAQYHMFHATDHPSAVSFMRWAKRVSSGYENRSLPGMGSERSD